MNFPRIDTQNCLRTVIDYSFSIFCLIILIPVILVLAISIKISGKGPVIFSQKRIGRFGKPFNIYKFRSMHCCTEENGALISGKEDKRITSLGRFMRKHKFDEIPNFINVIRGEMSLVGPRPEQQYYIDQILLKAPQYSLLKSIKPGITSWGQVKYGYASTVDEMIERLKYDLYYLENRSIRFDFKVASHTFKLIIRGQGI